MIRIRLSPSPLISGCLAAYLATSYTRFNSSPAPWGLYLLTLYLLSWLFLQSYTLLEATFLRLLQIALLSLLTIAGIGLWVYISIKDVRAFYGVEIVLFTAIALAAAVAVVFSIWLTWKEFWGTRRIRWGGEGGQQEQEYLDLFEMIEKKDNLDIEAFLQQNNLYFEEMELDENEKMALKRHCVRKHKAQPDYIKFIDCGICLEQIDINKESFCHPICHHPFHWNCIHPWFNQNKKACPNCKRDSRISLIKQIRAPK